MELDFERDFTVSIAKLFYFIGALVTTIAIYIEALSSGSNLFVAMMVTITVGFLPIVFVGLASAVVATVVAGLIRLWLRARQQFIDERAHAE